MNELIKKKTFITQTQLVNIQDTTTTLSTKLNTSLPCKVTIYTADEVACWLYKF